MPIAKYCILIVFSILNSIIAFAQLEESIFKSGNSTLQLSFSNEKINPTSWDIILEKNDTISLFIEHLDKFQNVFSANLFLSEKIVDFDLVEIKSNNRNIKQLFSSTKDSVKLIIEYESLTIPFQFLINVELINESNSKSLNPSDYSIVINFKSPFNQIDTDKESTSDKNTAPYYYFNQEVHSDLTTNNTFKKKNQSIDWISFQDRYLTVILNQKNNNYFDSKSITTIDKTNSKIKIQLPSKIVLKHNSYRWGLSVYSGPKSLKALSIDKSNNYDSLLFSDLWTWMQWLCLFLYRVLSIIFSVIGNWGLSIIMLALIVRIVLFPVSKRAKKSQGRFIAAQQLMRNDLATIKLNYKGGEQSERILRLYKKHGVSPFSGLKPLLVVLIQLPILIALFHVLGNVFEFRNQEFLWIQTLAEPDKLLAFGTTVPLLGSYFNLLPLLMSLVTLITFKLAPAPAADEKDKRMQTIFLLLMSISFFFIFYSFPSGMVLYWTCANLFQIIEHKLKP